MSLDNLGFKLQLTSQPDGNLTL